MDILYIVIHQFKRNCGKYKMNDKQLLISIITVVYNGEQFLEKTIQSVKNQTYKNIEYIIIDGGSTDGTVEIIKKYEDYIDYWVSEKDKGIYDAMNKGSQIATGDFINFLNADDIIYKNNTLENIVKNMINIDSVYYGRASIVSDKVCWIYPNKEVKDFSKWLKLNLPNHQTIFFPKSFYKNYFYDLRLSIGADDDYKLFALKNYTTKFIDEIVVEFQRGGVSSNHRSLKLFKQRLIESYIRNFKHKRWIRFAIDPFKLILMYLVHNIFGEDNFYRFIKLIVKLKG
jgi:putative colanic acid biosynthesis glycosyltransferase